MFKKKFIVITGGVGFIGSNLIELLLKKTQDYIISIDNYRHGLKKNQIKHKRVKYIKGETINISKILSKYKNNIKVVFHFGEYARIHQSFVDHEECFSSNIKGTFQVLEFCTKNKIKIIYSATSASLGNKGKDQYLSPYAYTKAQNLKMINQLNLWLGLRYEILYFYNVYGNKQISTGKMATVIGIFEEQYKKNRPMPVVKPGTQSRKFTHIKDTVNGCYLVWKKNKNAHYTLANNKSYKIIDVAKLFSSKIKLKDERLGERYKSVVVDKISNMKIHRINCNLSLKDYIYKFKQNNRF
jgi:UDP-glucose 4-epimerase